MGDRDSGQGASGAARSAPYPQAHLVVRLEDHADSAVRGLLCHGLVEFLLGFEVGGPVLPELAQGLGPGLCLLCFLLRGQLLGCL